MTGGPRRCGPKTSRLPARPVERKVRADTDHVALGRYIPSTHAGLSLRSGENLSSWRVMTGSVRLAVSHEMPKAMSAVASP